MEAKGKSENQKANLEMVLESISEDIRETREETARLFYTFENLNQKIDVIGSAKNEPHEDHNNISKVINAGFNKISEITSNYSYSLDKLQKLLEASERNIQKQIAPKESKVIHHHHISKGIWVAVILFILLSLESAGWLNTENKLDQYTENDTKYRFMRLDTSDKNMQVYLDSLDAKYKSDPNLSSMVKNLEDQYKKNIERLKKAEQLRQEAKDLENKVHFK
jgi:hypothetical protein